MKENEKYNNAKPADFADDNKYILDVCPFCGGNAKVAYDKCVETKSDGTQILIWKYWYVIHECRMFGKITSKFYNTEKDAAAAWNRLQRR